MTIPLYLFFYIYRWCHTHTHDLRYDQYTNKPVRNKTDMVRVRFLSRHVRHGNEPECLLKAAHCVAQTLCH
ncbi:ORF118 [Leucania separata nucleopolyhedrovirus]|uniref:ORF118 n=1 Tax=Leucania separata nucleopolyhedrovirus TaxID=1307956 RepID=Q0IL01_NPVLS|nr:ORF118 [Leucania separata nucleopolyhedrovirus]AAR28882.1 ORF118 [Leucania separata nucleopolyhedrovirus]